jgi:hypothetical protein
MTTVMLTTCIELGMTVDEEDPSEVQVEQRAETHAVRQQQRSTGPAKDMDIRHTTRYPVRSAPWI